MDLRTLYLLVTFLVMTALCLATDSEEKRSDSEMAADGENADIYDVMSSVDAEPARMTRGYIFRYGKRGGTEDSASRYFKWGKRSDDDDDDAYKRVFRWGKRSGDNQNAYKSLFRWGKRDQNEADKRSFGSTEDDDVRGALLAAAKRAHIFRYGRAPQGSPHVPFRFGEKEE